ncbi:MAG: hypothetical protein J6U02_03925 [Elusimicrobia bacterium]|nr:hypothetical protein [Elusimicrobiota bacterium]
MQKQCKVLYIPAERKLCFFGGVYVFNDITEKESQIIQELVSYTQCLYDDRERAEQKIEDIKTALYK